MTKPRFNDLVRKAAIRNGRRDEVDRAHGNAAPADCPIDAHVFVGLAALRSGMLHSSDDILAEAYDLLRSALERLRNGQTAGVAVVTKDGPEARTLFKLPNSTN